MPDVNDDFSTNTIANYNITGGALAVSGGVLGISGTTDGQRNAYHTTAVDYDDMESTFVLAAAPHASIFSSATARMNTTRDRWAAMHIRNNTPRVYLQRQGASDTADLITGVSPTIASGDAMQLQCRGSFYVLRKNGIQFASRWDWTNSVVTGAANRLNGMRIERLTFSNGTGATQFVSTGLAPLGSTDPVWIGEGFSATQTPIPGNVVPGDFMIGIAAKKAVADIVWPAGWTEVRDIVSGTMEASVGYRFYQAGDANAALPTGCEHCNTIAIRNIDPNNPFLVENYNTTNAAAETTPTVSNTDPKGFLVGAMANTVVGTQQYNQQDIQCPLAGAQVFRGPVQNTANVSTGMFHSYWPIATGSASFTCALPGAPTSSFNWIGILRPKSLTPKNLFFEMF